MPAIKARFWCWTLNNYDETELVSLRTSLSKEEVRYACFAKEVGEGGTPHLQGYTAFKIQKTESQCRSYLSPNVASFVCKGNEDQNVAYCSKQCTVDNPLEEFGVRDRSKGKRTDLESFKDAVKAGCVDLSILIEEHSGVIARYPRFVEQYVRKYLPVPDLVHHPLRPWQADLTNYLAGPPHAREIVFIVDPLGNGGKSWFVDQYLFHHPNSIWFTPGKSVDLKYAFYSMLKSPRVVFFDAPRARQNIACGDQEKSLIPYDFLEELKNGRMMNSKYNSSPFSFTVPHVVVMTNNDIDGTMLSTDRIITHTIS